jgi:hypothetical protein
VTGDGLAYAGSLTYDPVTLEGLWQQEASVPELASWFPVAARAAGVDTLKGIRVTGAMHVSSGGEMRSGQPIGESVLNWHHGSVVSDAFGLKAEQIELRAVIAWPDAVRVETLTFRFLGGSVRAEGLSVDINLRTVSATLFCEQIDLREFAALLDPERTKIVSAEGRLEGRLTLTIHESGRVAFGAGQLRLAPGSTALLRFQPVPGLLTTYLPEVVRNVYPGLGAIELGQTPLHVRLMRLELNPPDDARGRTAIIRLEGRPADPQFVAPLELDLNIFGPLEELFNTAVAARNRLKAGGS